MSTDQPQAARHQSGHRVTLHLPDGLENLLADLRDAHHRTQNAAIGDLVAQIETQVREGKRMSNDQPQEARYQSGDPTLIAEFLLARITEDETAARECQEEVGTTRAGELYPDGSGPAEFDDFPSDPYAPRPAELTHIFRWDPARVLRECEAKRRIVGLECENWGGYPDGFYDAQEQAIGALAAVYADHPDYRDEWRP